MHADVAASLHRLGNLYAEANQLKKALPLLVRALRIREKALGRSHPDVATTLDILAGVRYSLGERAAALPLFLRALEMREKTLGSMHPDVAETLSNLALIYIEQAAYAKAEPLIVRSLAIREKALGPTHPDLAITLINLAGLHEQQGAYKKAEPIFVRALDILDKALGPMHPYVAFALNALGLLYIDEGVYTKAEPLLSRALDIREKSLGPTHALVASSLDSLALLYRNRGAFGKAEPLLVRAVDISENALGPMHPIVANALANLGSFYRDQGAFGKAEPLYLRALDIDEKAKGLMHRDVANHLTNLAWLYLKQGAYGRAEPLALRALDISEKALGPTHPEVAVALVTLAALYTDQGAHGKAESLYLRALRIDEKMLARMHPEVAKDLDGLGRLYRVQGARDKALAVLTRSVAIREAQLRTELPRLSESRRRALMTVLGKETASVVSFQVDAMPASERALQLALTTVLRRKGRILDSLAETQATLRSHLTPALRAQLDQLAQARTELSRLWYSPPNPHDGGNRTAAIAAGRARVEGLEAKLGTASVELRAQSAPITIANVRAALPPGAMLVEFVRYQRFASTVAEQSLQPDRYVAYLMTRQGPLQWVSLGDAAPIDAAVDAALATLHRAATTDATRAALQALDDLVLAPIRPQLAGISHVILAPDSKLNLVPFEALIDSERHYEIEQRLMSYVTSGRDLLRLAVRREPRSPPVIVASPDYGPLPSPSAIGIGSFAPLAGAAAEVHELQRFFPTAPVVGAAATKHALAALAGPAILHVATHGFYTHDVGATLARDAPTSTAAGGSSGPLAKRGMALVSGSSPPPPPPADEPLDGLDQAGLAMAGANQGADGIVTAREIAGFDWWGTKLVVLSACETGVGAVPSGDGVYGLRRAVVLAGAEAQVVSLWNIGDLSAQVLMRAYYDELARGTGRAEAMREAKLRLLRQPAYAHPRHWAAFILAGDWTPLDARVFRAAGSIP